MLRVLLLLAFLVVPVLEIWFLIRLGQVIGGWPTIGLLIAGSVLGAWLVRREGRRAWTALQNAIRSGRMPDRELADGALIVAGGTLLLAPGLLTDIVGYFMILPVTRPIARQWLTWFFTRRLARRAYGPPLGGPIFPGAGPAAGDPAWPGGRPRRVVPGTVIEDDPGSPDR